MNEETEHPAADDTAEVPRAAKSNDISTIVAKNHVFEATHPATGENIGLRITLRPKSHKAPKAVQRNWTTQALRNRKLTADQLEARAVELIVALVEKWEWHKDHEGNESDFKGEKIPLNETNLRTVLKALPWLRDQIDNEAGNDASFFQA